MVSAEVSELRVCRMAGREAAERQKQPKGPLMEGQRDQAWDPHAAALFGPYKERETDTGHTPEELEDRTRSAGSQPWKDSPGGPRGGWFTETDHTREARRG